MKILLTAMAETDDPTGRCRTVATMFKNTEIEVATSLIKDVNDKKINGIKKKCFLETPMSLGLPKVTAKRLFHIVQNSNLPNN